MSEEEQPVEENEEPVEEEEAPAEEEEEAPVQEEPAEEEEAPPVEEKEEPAPVQEEAPAEEFSGSFEKPEDAWDAIAKDKNQINWYLYQITKKLKFKFYKAGNGGLKEFCSVLSEGGKMAAFGLLRVNSTDKGGSVRAKFVFCKFIGTGVGVMHKAKITPNSGRFSDHFPVKHLTYDLTESLEGFDVDHLAREFLRVGGAHKPDAYVFGPGAEQTFQCS